MPPEDSFNPLDWLRIAENDLDRVIRLLEDGDMAGAGFYLQQTTEKYLKVYLLSHGWSLRKTHNLDALMSELTPYLPETEIFRAVCQRITDFYWADRYPNMAELGPNLNEIKTALDEIRPLLALIKAKLT